MPKLKHKLREAQIMNPFFKELYILIDCRRTDLIDYDAMQVAITKMCEILLNMIH